MSKFRVTYDDQFGEPITGVYDASDEHDALLSLLHLELGVEVEIEEEDD